MAGRKRARDVPPGYKRLSEMSEAELDEAARITDDDIANAMAAAEEWGSSTLRDLLNAEPLEDDE